MLPSKAAVRKAGKRIVSLGDPKYISQTDLQTIDEWRRAHLPPLVAISMWLRSPALKRGAQAPAQRLKRRDTLIDKLISRRARDASTMHDLGGCRLVFQDLKSLYDSRQYLDSETRARHVLTHPSDKYDYIAYPKGTGYRGLHYVYGYAPSSTHKKEYSGLKIEVQLRTSVQHSWATAVEIADLVSETRIKFEDGSGDAGQFFRLASELLSRRYEGMQSCCPSLTDADLRDEFNRLEDRIGLLDRLGKLREQGEISRIKRHTVFAFMSNDTVNIFGFSRPQEAMAKELELTVDKNCVNVVYVSSTSEASIRSSYRNYLTNPEDFVKLLSEALD